MSLRKTNNKKDKLYINNINASNTINVESTSGNNNTDINDLTYNIKYENNIEEPAVVNDNESGISPLVFNFSKPASISTNNELMNLEFIKIIKKFNISYNAHKKIAAHFNSILERSVDLTYRASIPYYTSELLKRFSSIEKKKYDICHKGCRLFNEANITACSNCSEPRYKEDSDDQGHANKLTPGHGQYFRTSLATTIRTKESFQNYDESSSSDRTGLNGQLPLAKLSSFSNPLFFALDEMHGLFHGIAKQIWGLVCGKYGEKNSLVLSLVAQREIGAAMAMTRSTISTSFHGAWINVSTRFGYSRAVD
ncbi:hypothetical protein PHYBLDRAFT_174661 [Phycomyces blakesleeanus NRRL 1555(-)]|uniref:Uncharacterized protein n=1 Tax=Phycomyces blakesleeanus (strain ATCC 8743b / DSM 1359 / FGSC 10004 / NBRC 33097 / NRRL 1555) TaxID=763407 RepID=A0A167JYZ7_PHYB8|nr:hypothetical protein PHYBLDRAFT_174661 [Phycomyces blakesleeanus NRRL 1555(-)]OAD66950.1 hypothetical protein PHYBLDRAFT_174661 [Phycomyces blakesleeanus NRRL 1555(-)]|eukprot:XP_018284990.1 hypothetical protein PHYBLDRAFT_174661 [Phycomyces blakesleeanus NRRL 1555(-)]